MGNTMQQGSSHVILRSHIMHDSSHLTKDPRACTLTIVKIEAKEALAATM